MTWFVRAAIVALLALGSVPAFADAQNVPALAAGLPQDTAVHTGRLANGLTYYVQRHGSPADRVELRLVVRAGSVLEDPDQRGLAHLLEHMAFDGSAHFAHHAVWDFMQRHGMQGGADVNAMTTFDYTAFQLTVPTDTPAVLDSALLVVRDWTHDLSFNPDEFARERNVVIEEWRLGLGSRKRINDRQFPLLAAGSRYAIRQTIGSEASLDTATLAAVKRFYHDWYRPDLMAVIVVGDIDADRMVARIRREFSTIPGPIRPRPRPVYRIRLPHATRVSVVADSEATGSSVDLIYERPHTADTTLATHRTVLEQAIFIDLLNERLSLDAVAARAPFIRATASDVSPWLGGVNLLDLSASVPDSGMRAGVRGILAELGRIRRDGFTPVELAREKERFERTWAHREAIRHGIPSASLASALVSRFILGDQPPPGMLELHAIDRRLLATISTADVRAAGLALTDGAPPLVLASGPAKSGSDFPSTRTLRMAALSTAPILPSYRDSTLTAPLVARLPAAGHVTHELRIDSLGIRIWTLSNGIRVILDSTALNRDQILVAGYRNGGLSAVPDDSLAAVESGLPVVARSGLGSFSADMLRRRLAGTVARVAFDFGAYTETVSASGSPRDAAAIFRLVYLQLTAPRLDSGAVRQAHRSLVERVAHRAADPQSAFADSLRVLVANHSPRVHLIGPQSLRDFNPAEALAFMRQRIADDSGFTFAVVGAFDPDSLRPMIEQFIGGLPGSGHASGWRDDGIRPPRTVISRTIRKGPDDRATLRLVFFADADSSSSASLDVTALGYTIQERLWQRLRQELGGVYGVTADGAVLLTPKPTSRIDVTFSADPSRLPELMSATMAELDSIRANGPTAVELSDFKAAYARSFESAIQTNSFWLQRIMSYDRHGWPVDGIREPDGEVGALSANEIRDAARVYINLQDYVKLALEPRIAASAQAIAPDAQEMQPPRGRLPN
ncbi:MAG: M16 family metallopeptidase [Gemmatimonadaceae bacterium]